MYNFLNFSKKNLTTIRPPYIIPFNEEFLTFITGRLKR